MEFLVTGGAGFIGSNIVRKLVGDGKSVRVLDNLSTGNIANLEDILGKLELIRGDLRDETVTRRAVAGVRCVLHLGALPSVSRSVEDPLESNDVNVRGTLQLLTAARDAGVQRFVFSSSSSVYGNTLELPKRETMLPQPLSPYAIQKLTGEHYCAAFFSLYGLPTFALRYFNVYGPRQNPNSDYAAVIPSFISAVLRGKAPVVHGDGSQTRDFTFVEDVASANLACCAAPVEAAGRVYNVARGDRMSIAELARMIIRAAGATGLEPQYVGSRPGDVRDSQADASRARESLGWQPRIGFEEGLRRTIEWFSVGGRV